MRYFEKIAKNKKSNKPYNIGIGVGGMAAGTLINPMDPGGIIGRKATDIIVKNIKEMKDPKLMQYGLDKAKKMGVETTIAKGRLPELGAYFPGLKAIKISKNLPDFLMHEVGHASSYKKFKSLSKFRTFGIAAAPLAITATAVTRKDSIVSKVAPYAAGAALTPMLADEAVASVKAMKDLKRATATKKQLSIARKNLGKGFASYALGAAGLVGVPALIRKFKKPKK
jgi:hypothetical protein